MRWIGLAGKMGTGKDYTYKTMRQMVELAVPLHTALFRISFADSLRHEIEGAFKQELPMLWEKPYPEEIRRLLQWWGTDFRRAEDPDYWVKKTRARAIDASGQDRFGIQRLPVFTDVRFPNEAQMIVDQGGVVAKVYTSDDIRRQRLGIEPPTHESETALDGFHFKYHIDSSADDGKYREGIERVLRAAEVL